MKLDGVSSGTRIEIAIETAGKAVHTAVTAHFPQSVDVGFTALRTSLPGFLQGLFGQDIRIGHRVFDDLFKVSGYPETSVRELLQRPGLADTLANIALRTDDVQMNHALLYFRLPGAMTTSRMLARDHRDGAVGERIDVRRREDARPLSLISRRRVRVRPRCEGRR